MKARDLINKLRANLEQLKQEREEQTLRITNDLAALVKLRIQSSGTNFKGSPFAPYTPSYQKTRNDKGFQTGYVDFTKTGRLMANIQARTINVEGEKARVQISAGSQDNIDKLRGAVKKRGNILIPSQDEIQLAAEANRERIAKIFE